MNYSTYSKAKDPLTGQVYELKTIPTPKFADACFGCAFRPAGTEKCRRGRDVLGHCRPDNAVRNKDWPVWKVKE